MDGAGHFLDPQLKLYDPHNFTKKFKISTKCRKYHVSYNDTEIMLMSFSMIFAFYAKIEQKNCQIFSENYFERHIEKL